jgi:hypothetical protein
MPYKDPEVAKQKNRERYLAKREQILAQTKLYYETHKEEAKKRQREWFAAHPEKVKEYSAKWRATHPEENRARILNYKNRLRDQVFDHYGRHCQCCGEDQPEFLGMDHVFGGGNKHRREANLTNSTDLFLWIIRHDFPPDFQTLCHNCNLAKGFYGECPHKREPEYGIGVAC